MTTPEDRSNLLVRTRNLKMARSAHAYVRGSTTRFYDWLRERPASVPEGPPIWICGDCHVGNLGPTADGRGRVAVQIRDLDQTVIGNPAHDLIRLGLSLASAARGSDLPGVVTARILEQLSVGYAMALSGDFSQVSERAFRPKTVRQLLGRSTKRRWKHLAAERLETVEPVIPLGARLWALTASEREALKHLVEEYRVRDLLSGLENFETDAPVTMVDAAYWMKGCSSLGKLRFAVMLRIGEGKGASLCLVDIKEAVEAAAPRNEAAVMPENDAERVVAGAQALSPHLGRRMIAASVLERPVVLRELMPQDLKIDIDRLNQDEAMALSSYLAAVVGRAHGRQMDEPTRRAWLEDLSRAHAGNLEAPSWLWASVVDLLAIHERAYLEHCRLFALSQAA